LIAGGRADGKVYVNVASSTEVLEGFLNLDSHVYLKLLNLPQPMQRLLPRRHQEGIKAYRDARRRALLVAHDCRRPLPFPASSVDHILCSHFLEHVYPQESDEILRDFHRVLKPSATMHLVVPDLRALVDAYTARVGQRDDAAADAFVHDSLLSRETRGSTTYRLLEFLGRYGLQHRWMYDAFSLGRKVRAAGFLLLDSNTTASREFRAGDGSVHLVAMKPDPQEP
jgi:predicted SAM-dependent methyltransferase